jgi:hypothetical protein
MLHGRVFAGYINQATFTIEQARYPVLDRIVSGIGKINEVAIPVQRTRPAEVREGKRRNDISTLEKFRVIANLKRNEKNHDRMSFSTYFSELHNEVHQRPSRICIANVCSALQ